MIFLKRGDTLSYIGTVKVTEIDPPSVITDFTDWQIRCQIRVTSTDQVQSGVVASWVNAALGTWRLEAPATATKEWQIAKCYMDIELTDTLGNVISTPSHEVEIQKDATRPNV